AQRRGHVGAAHVFRHEYPRLRMVSAGRDMIATVAPPERSPELPQLCQPGRGFLAKPAHQVALIDETAADDGVAIMQLRIVEGIAVLDRCGKSAGRVCRRTAFAKPALHRYQYARAGLACGESRPQCREPSADDQHIGRVGCKAARSLHQRSIAARSVRGFQRSTCRSSRATSAFMHRTKISRLKIPANTRAVS